MNAADQLFWQLIVEKMEVLQVQLDELQTQKDKLENVSNGNRNGHRASKAATPRTASHPAKQKFVGRTWKEKVTEFLTANGPATTGEILEATKMPRGTSGSVLTESNGDFKKVGKQWTLVEQ